MQPRMKGAETPPRGPGHETSHDPQNKPEKPEPSSPCKSSLSKCNVDEKLAHGEEPSRSPSTSPEHSVASSKSERKECGVSSTTDPPASLEMKGDPKSEQADVDDADDGAWETVEVKPRRKKSQVSAHCRTPSTYLATSLTNNSSRIATTITIAIIMDGGQVLIIITTTTTTATTTGGDTTMEEGTTTQTTTTTTIVIAITTMVNVEREIDDARGDSTSKISPTKWSRMSYRIFWTQLMKR